MADSYEQSNVEEFSHEVGTMEYTEHEDTTEHQHRESMEHHETVELEHHGDVIDQPEEEAAKEALVYEEEDVDPDHVSTSSSNPRDSYNQVVGELGHTGRDGLRSLEQENGGELDHSVNQPTTLETILELLEAAKRQLSRDHSTQDKYILSRESATSYIYLASH